jgi:hypothetical protein
MEVMRDRDWLLLEVEKLIKRNVYLEQYVHDIQNIIREFLPDYKLEGYVE